MYISLFAKPGHSGAQNAIIVERKVCGNKMYSVHLVQASEEFV